MTPILVGAVLVIAAAAAVFLVRMWRSTSKRRHHASNKHNRPMGDPAIEQTLWNSTIVTPNLISLIARHQSRSNSGTSDFDDGIGGDD